MQARSVFVTAVAGLVLAGSSAAATTAIPSGNLVKNPGGDLGPGATSTGSEAVPPPGWETARTPPDTGPEAGGFSAARYGSHPYFPTAAVSAAIRGGKNFFWAGYQPSVSTAAQTIDVGGAASDIDRGGVKACVSAHLGSLKKNPDSSVRLDLEFLNAEGGRLGQLRLGTVRGATLTETILLRRTAQGVVPRSTRQLRVVITGQRPVSGGAIYGYADNVGVGLTRGACEPVLAVRCTRGTLVATVTPGAIARTQRVRFGARAASGGKQVDDARAPFSARFAMTGLTGSLTVTATVSQAGVAPVVLTRKSRRC